MGQRAVEVKGSIYLGMLLALGGWASPARAEPSAGTAAADSPASAAPAAPRPAALPSDIVQLKNGGMVRGTIAEVVPGQWVTIITMAGETRKIPFADVSYAGPADKAPSAASAAPAPPTVAATTNTNTSTTRSEAHPFAVVQAAEAQVSYESDPSSGTLFVRTATAVGHGRATAYDELCTAPCSVSMPAGKHVFAIQQPDSRQVEADQIEIPAGPSTLKSEYVSRAGTRAAFIVTGSVLLVGGLTTTLVGVANSDSDGFETALLVGGGLEIAGLGVMLTGALFSNSVTLSVTPGVAGPSRSAVFGRPRAGADQEAPAQRSAGSSLVPEGLTVSARF